MRALLVAMSLVSCTGEFIITENNCSPGTSKSCQCHSGGEGLQVCADNGWYYEKCECVGELELTQASLAGVWHFGDPIKGTLVVDGIGQVEGGWLLIREEEEGARWPITGGQFDVTEAAERQAALQVRVGGFESSSMDVQGRLDDAVRVFTGRPANSDDELELRRVWAGGSGWFCHPDWKGDDDGCDCGCGAPDDACDAGNCDWCFDELGKVASCS